jgi:uncharacterized protein (UPF0335 family)
MPKKQAKNYNVEIMQPDEIGALRKLVKEFVEKINTVDSEIVLLKDDRKDIIEAYTEKLDVKTLQAALKVIKIQNEVTHRDTFDLFLEALNEGSTVP